MRFSEFFVIHHSDRKVLTFLLALATILVVLIYLTGNDGGETVLTAADSLAAEEQPGYGKGRQAPPYRAYQTQDGRQTALNYCASVSSRGRSVPSISIVQKAASSVPLMTSDVSMA